MPTRAPATGSLDRQVRELRHSSRQLVRVLGLMGARMDGVGCTPAQCHTLVEVLGNGRLTTGELAELLEVDKSTASRSVSGLVREGLLEVEVPAEDKRTKPVRLTPLGVERVRALHGAADAQVRGALELLTEAERETVLAGVSLYQRALHRSKALAGVGFRPIEARDDPAMARIIRSVMTEFGAVGRGFSIEDAEVDAMSSTYAAERSAFFVAERDGVLLGGGGIAPLSGADRGDVCELRKMYTLPEARGLGVGRGLLERCLAAARAEGFAHCYLETLDRMDRARTLYEKFGFRRLDGPMGNTGHFACDDWMVLDL